MTPLVLLVVAPGVNPKGPLPPPRVPVTARDGRCNIGLPNKVFDRLVWVVNYYARAGFYVVIDNHVWLEDPTAYENPKLWVQLWTRLAAAIAKVGGLSTLPGRPVSGCQIRHSCL